MNDFPGFGSNHKALNIPSFACLACWDSPQIWHALLRWRHRFGRVTAYVSRSSKQKIMWNYKFVLSVFILRLLLILFISVVAVSGQCQSVVTVDRELGVDCSTLTQSLVDQTCNNLKDVLRSISLHTTKHASGGCINVTLQPGVHVLTELFHIQQSLVLQGTQNVMVTVNLTDATNSTLQLVPQYVLSFTDTEQAMIRRIDFHTSPAIIGFENVTNVIIEESSFR